MRSACGLGIVLAMATLGASAVAAAPADPTRESLLVVPFEHTGRDGRVHWLTEAAATVVAGQFEADGVPAIAREERLEAYERLQLPVTAALSQATVIRVGQLIGAAHVVTGSFGVTEDRLTVRARRIRLDSGRATSDVVEEGRLAELFEVFARTARRLLPEGVSPRSALRVPPVSLPAFENFIKGLMAESPAAQVRFLTAALALAPDHDAARMALWRVYTAQGDHQKAVAAVVAVPAASPVARRSRFLAGLSHIELRQYDEAFRLLRALVDEAPSAALYNNLGVVQNRRGGTPQTGRATYYFNQAVEADRDDPDYAFNLGYAYWIERDAPASLYWLKEAVRRNPGDGDAHFVLSAALTATGASAEAERERDLAHRLSSVYDEWERRPGGTSDPVPKGLERLRRRIDFRRLTAVDSTLVPTDQREQQELAAFHLDRGRRLYEEEHDGEAITELRRSIFLSPYQAPAHLLLGRLYLRSGRPREAVDALQVSIWCHETASARAVLGEAYLQLKDLERARMEWTRAVTLDPQSPDARRLAEKLQNR